MNHLLDDRLHVMMMMYDDHMQSIMMMYDDSVFYGTMNHLQGCKSCVARCVARSLPSLRLLPRLRLLRHHESLARVLCVCTQRQHLRALSLGCCCCVQDLVSQSCTQHQRASPCLVCPSCAQQQRASPWRVRLRDVKTFLVFPCLSATCISLPCLSVLHATATSSWLLYYIYIYAHYIYLAYYILLAIYSLLYIAYYE